MLYWYPYEGPLMPIYGTVFKELMRNGVEITIVTSFPHYRKGNPETWVSKQRRLFEVSHWEGATVVRSYVYAPVVKNEKLAILGRALSFLSFNFTSLVASVLLVGKADLIFAPSSPPLTNGIIAYVVSRFKRCPMVYNVQDLYPDIAVDMALVRNCWLVKTLRILEKIVYKASNRVLTVSQGMRDLIVSKGVPKGKIEVIENFIDPQFVTPQNRDNYFSRRYGLHNAFVLMYAGNIGIPHGVEVLVGAARLLEDVHDIIFCMVARGEYKDAVEKLARQQQLRNMMFLPPQPEEVTPLIWASASAGVVSYRKGLSHYSVPSKLFAVMCAARPVIASVDADSQTAAIVETAGCGLCVRPESPEEIAAAVMRLRNEPHLAEQMGQRGRDYVERHLNKDTIAGRYDRFFKNLAGNKDSMGCGPVR
jgi:colanic acid biosynthesis glycosyl transferase WcaI